MVDNDEAMMNNHPSEGGFWKKCYNYFLVKTPKAAYFLLPNEALESFSYYGATAVIMIYLKEELETPQWIVKNIYHITQVSNVAFPVIGSLLADMYIGKFLIIVPVDWIWMVLYTVLAVTSYSPFLNNKSQQIVIAIVCLLTRGLCGLATPSAVAFPGDQYKASETKARDDYYYALYFAVNVGSISANLITPHLRASIHNCVPDSQNCFPAAFGFHACVSLVATALFLSGIPFYTHVKPKKETNLKLLKCCGYGISRVCHKNFKSDRAHWMDLADDKYDEQCITDVKTIVHVMLLFTTYPMFFALFDQQPSLWTLMSSKLDGRTVFGQILPDKMDAANPLMVMILIPLFAAVIYPLCAKMQFLRKPLERISCGFILCALSCAIGGIISLVIESNLPAYPKSDAVDIVYHNGLPCDVTLVVDSKNIFIAKYMGVQKSGLISGGNAAVLLGHLSITDSKCALVNTSNVNFVVDVDCGFAYSVVFGLRQDTGEIGYHQALQNRSRHLTNSAKVRFAYIGPKVKGRELAVLSPGLKYCFPLEEQFLDDYESYKSTNLINDETKICWTPTTAMGEDHPNCVCGFEIEKFIFARGGIYDVLIIEDEENTTLSVFTTAEPDSVSILLQLPMYAFLTAGEVMCCVTAYSFAYSESPVTTRSILQSVLYVAVSFGNVIVIIVDFILYFLFATIQRSDPYRPEEIPKPSIFFFCYSLLMVLDAIYFTYLARRYKYKNPVYQAIK